MRRYLRPWANQKINVTPTWFIDVMQQKIQSIDWQKAANDVTLFLNTRDKESLNLWGIDFFMDVAAMD